MWSKIGFPAAAGLALALAAPAVMAQQQPGQAQANQAQSASPQPSSGGGAHPAAGAGQVQAGAGGMTGPGATSVRQHIQHDLEQAGFKNVKLAPAAFVAQATDQQGHPVLMLINPDSVTVLTEVNGSMQPGAGGGMNGSTGGGAAGAGTTSSK